ncbi:MAG: ATP-dependent RecD-like DNA helicase [Clostridia bacterium]|nr:ATP-dependent RecD-like DNA helicase [Clostridia bacterium]
MQENNSTQLSGTVESVTFHNEDSGFTVLELNTGDDLVTVVGVMAEVCPGEELRLTGGWVNHASYGPQFKAEACERALPTSTAAIYRYLASGAVKGIGMATARRLVDAFGENTLKIMENEPKRMAEIRGISEAKAIKISEEFKKMFGVREVMLFLGEYGITPAEAMRVWKVWGAASVDRVRQNPYLLCNEGVAIGFDRADAIARAAGMAEDDEMRIRAGAVHVLRHNAGVGHTCLPEDKLVETTAQMLEVSVEAAAQSVCHLVDDSSVVREPLRRGSNIRDFIFIPSLHRAEHYAAGRLKMMVAYPPTQFRDIEADIARVEKETGIHYENLQREAIRKALSQGVLILTGGPGTGKTTTLNAIIRLLEQKGQRVLLAAPTGRAAKRMAEVTGQEAKTIHRLLEVEWDPNNRPVFGRNEHNMLECDALIVDELSMVDSALFSSLLQALPLGCRLILVGDSDQLPSVGAGDVLHELIASGMLPTVQLQEVFRQSLQSLIVSNAHKIVRGELPELRRRNGDFFFLEDHVREHIRDTIVQLYTTRLPKSYGYSPLSDIQVLCPGRKGELGVHELNLRLQEAVNPPQHGKTEITINGMTFRVGDKVMQIKNDYDIPWSRADGTNGTGVFNGDVGILKLIDRPTETIVIVYDDREAVYSFDTAGNLDLAYATTVHKSQGSEFEAVIMPMYPGPPQLYYRNLLYTAVTRAKSLLILVGMDHVVARMVENDRRTKRYSGLCCFLTGGDAE